MAGAGGGGGVVTVGALFHGAKSLWGRLTKRGVVIETLADLDASQFS